MTLRKILKLRGAIGAPNFFLFLLPPPKSVPNGRHRHPKGGADGTAPPEDERNPAEGGCFASIIELDIFLNQMKALFL